MVVGVHGFVRFRVQHGELERVEGVYVLQLRGFRLRVVQG